MNKILKAGLIPATALAFGVIATGSASADTTVTVKSGDTLNAIASQYNTTATEIGDKNGIKNINLIYVGDTIIIPGATANTTQKDEVQVATEQVKTTTQATSSALTNSDALNSLIARESGGNVNATNGQYYGIGQLSPQARAMYGGNSSDYNDQLNAMKAYIAARYGTAENAWAHSQATGWY